MQRSVHIDSILFIAYVENYSALTSLNLILQELFIIEKTPVLRILKLKCEKDIQRKKMEKILNSIIYTWKYSKKKFIYPCIFPHVSRFISVANSYIRNGEPFPFPFEKTT